MAHVFDNPWQDPAYRFDYTTYTVGEASEGDRALTIANRGILKQCLITRVTHGVLQPDPCSAQQPELPYIPVPSLGGGTESYRLFTDKEVEELEDLLPKEFEYSASILINLRSAVRYELYSYPLVDAKRAGAAYAFMHSATTAYGRLDGHPGTIGAVLRLTSGAAADIWRPQRTDMELLPGVRLGGSAQYSLRTPEALKYAIVFDASVLSGSLWRFEEQPVPVALETEVYSHASTIDLRLVEDSAYLYDTVKLAHKSIDTRVILFIDSESTGQIIEHAVSSFRHMGRDNSILTKLEGRAAYRLNTVDLVLYEHNAGGGVALRGASSAVFTQFVELETANDSDDEEDLLMLIAAYMVGN